MVGYECRVLMQLHVHVYKDAIGSLYICIYCMVLGWGFVWGRLGDREA